MAYSTPRRRALILRLSKDERRLKWLLRQSGRPPPGFADSISGRTSEYGNREKAGAQNTQGEDAEGKSSSYGAECFCGLT